jgi:uncharacterized protein
MFIDTNKIGIKGLHLEDSIEPDEDLLIEDDSFFADALTFSVHLSREGQKIKARGWIRTLLTLHCVNCLDNFELKVDSKFDLILFPVHLIDTGHSALRADEMEYIFYEGDEIDLEKILMEQVNLFIPYNPSCNDFCKGICPTCGTNLNYEECHCELTSQENDMSIFFSKLKR